MAARGEVARRSSRGRHAPTSSPRSPYGSPASSMPRKARCSPSGDQRASCTSRRAAPARAGSPPLAATAYTAGACADVGRRRSCRRRTRCACRRATTRCSSTDQSPRVDAPCARAGAGRLDEEVHVAIAVALAVVAPVGARDHARERLRSAPQRADGEARLRRRGRQREPRAVGRRARTPRRRAAARSAARGRRRPAAPPRPARRAGRARARLANCGEESRTSPAVSARGRPPSSGATHTCLPVRRRHA